MKIAGGEFKTKWYKTKLSAAGSEVDLHGDGVEERVPAGQRDEGGGCEAQDKSEPKLEVL